MIRALLLALIAVVASAQNLKFLESGTSATQDLTFFPATSGTVSSVTSPSLYGSRSVEVSAGGYAMIGEDANRLFNNTAGRISFYFRTDGTDVASMTIGSLTTIGGTGIFTITTNSSSQLVLTDVADTTTSTGTTALSTNTWYRISVAYTGTPATPVLDNVKVFLDGNQEISVTSFSITSYSTIGSWQFQSSSSPRHGYYAHVYVDDSNSLTDTGDVRVTPKLPASTNSDGFTTIIGSCANHKDCVDERPLSTTNGLEQDVAPTSQSAQNFTIETASAGDLDVSTATLIGSMGWVWAKKGLNTSTPALSTSGSNASAGTAGTTLQVTISASSGDFVECAMADQVGGSAPTFSDSTGGSNTWSTLNGSTNTVRKTSAYSRLSSAISSVTATFGSSSASRAMVCGRFTGITTSPLDTNPADTNDSTSPYDATLSGTLAQANSLVTGSFALAGPLNDTVAAGASETGVIKTATNLGQAQVASCNNNLNSTGTSLTCAMTGGNANDLVVVVVGDQKASTAPSISDASGGSNTYTALTGGTNTVRCTAWYSRIAAATGTITITLPSTNASAAVAAYRFTGDQATPLDKNPAMVNDNSSAYTGPLSTTLSQANEFLVTYGCLAAPSGDTTTASTNVTALVKGASSGGSAGANSSAIIGYQIQSATTSVQGSWTNSTTTRTGIMGTATFKSSGLAVTTDSTAALTYRVVSATTSISPQITNSTANRTGVGGTASFKGAPTFTPQITMNGSDTAITLTTSNALYVAPLLSATYPSNAAGIGMKSGGPAETLLYEGGVLIGYRPAASTLVPRLTLLGIGQ